MNYVLALKIERRSIAAAVLAGRTLEHAQVRQLSSVAEKAEATTVGFVHWLLHTFDVGSAALEVVPTGQEIRRELLSRAAVAVLRQAGVPLWEASRSELPSAFGAPALKSRSELRQAIVSIWPTLLDQDRHEEALDAAALGLYVQTERLFLNA